LNSRAVSHGKTAKTVIATAAKIKVLIVNGAKMNPSASTVPRSLMKHAASTTLP
jgi:hypothetical protein